MNKYETNYIKKTCKKNSNRESWIIKENTHEPIIKCEEYKKVQEIKLSKKKTTKIKHEFLLQDLLYCGHCKRKLQYKVYKPSYNLYNDSGFICNYFYRKECKNNTYIKEKDLNEIIKKEIIKRLKLIEINKITNKLINYYKEINEDMQRIKKYKNEIKKLERKKSILYKKKCEEYITINEFKTEYSKAKEEIEKYEMLIKELEQDNEIKLNERKIIEQYEKGNYITNNFLKEIINKIEIYSKNRIEITYKFS